MLLTPFILVYLRCAEAHTPRETKQVCVQLPTSADDVALPAFVDDRRPCSNPSISRDRWARAFAAERRAAVPLGAGRCHISCPSGPQQQTRRSGVRRPQDGTDRQTDGQTDRRTERVGIREWVVGCAAWRRRTASAQPAAGRRVCCQTSVSTASVRWRWDYCDRAHSLMTSRRPSATGLYNATQYQCSK